MVILDGNIKSSMLTNGVHQYIQPDSFPSMSSTMDAKSSPLAMLQKTCSQIGADSTPPAKTSPAIPSLERCARGDDKKEHSVSAPSAALALDKPAFKPYELTDKHHQRKSPLSKTSTNSGGSGRKTPKSVSPSSISTSSGTKAASPITRSGAEVLAGIGTSASVAGKDLTSVLASLQRPGLLSPLALPQSASYLAQLSAAAELSSLRAAGLSPALFGHSAAAAALYGLGGSAPAGVSHLPHPALLPPHLQPPVLSAARVPGDLGSSTNPSLSAAGSPLRCPNPYCTCTHPVDSVCVAGCLHCEQVRGLAVALGGGASSLAAAGVPYLGSMAGLGAAVTSLPLSVSTPASMASSGPVSATLVSPTSSTSLSPSTSASVFSASSLSATPPASSSSAASVNSSGSAAALSTQPLVCSWMADGRYCGKRFASTDELMLHLRSHTGAVSSALAPVAGADPMSLYMLHQQQQQQQYQASLLAAAAMATGATAPSAPSGNPGARPPFATISPPSPGAISSASARFHPYLSHPSVSQSLKIPASLQSAASSVPTPLAPGIPSVSPLTAHPGHQASLAAAAAYYSPLAAAASMYGRHPPLP